MEGVRQGLGLPFYRIEGRGMAVKGGAVKLGGGNPSIAFKGGFSWGKKRKGEGGGWEEGLQLVLH